MEMMKREELPEGEYTGKGGMAYAAKALSIVLNPLVVPIYIMLVFLYGNTILALTLPSTKMFLLAVVTLNALVIPIIAIKLLKWLGMISDVSFENRYDRTVVLAIIALCYGLCVYTAYRLSLGVIVHKFFIASFCCVMIALIVTPFWKISLHMIPMGGATAMFAIYMLAGIGSLFLTLIITIILSGMLASARLYLGLHTPAQVAVGYLTGFLTTSVVILLL